jgi:hypothetical protein
MTGGVTIEFDSDCLVEVTKDGHSGKVPTTVVFGGTDTGSGPSIEANIFSEPIWLVRDLLSSIYPLIAGTAFEVPVAGEFVARDSEGDSSHVSTAPRIQVKPGDESATVVLTRDTRPGGYRSGDIVPWPPDSRIATLEVATEDYGREVIETAEAYVDCLDAHSPGDWRAAHPHFAFLLECARDIEEYADTHNSITGYEVPPDSDLVERYLSQDEYTDRWFERFLVDTGVVEAVVADLQQCGDDAYVAERYENMLFRVARSRFFRAAVATALVDHPDRRAEEPLRACIYDEKPAVVLPALRALAEIGGPTEAFGLSKVLAEMDHEQTRGMAAELLAGFDAEVVADELSMVFEFDHDDGAAVLEALATDDNESVRRMARAHLDKVRD